MTDIKHPSELKFVFETHFRQFAGCYSGSCCSTSIVVGRTKQKAAWIIEMSSFLAGCHVLSPWLVVSNVSFPTVPEDDDTQWLFCATTNQTECILFDAVVVGYIMSILSSISFGSNPMIPPINSCTASMLFLVFAAAYTSHPLRSCRSLSNARCWWIVA